GPKRVMREAEILVRGGARIIPIGMNKRPFIRWTKYRTTAPTADEIRDWCLDSRTDGWAVLCGPVSGGWLGIDIEAPGMLYPEITGPLAALPSTCKRKSLHAGGHAHVRVYGAPAGYDWGGSVIAKIR